MTAQLNVLSLFAGIGGLELGLERAGMTTVGQVELDPYCRRVLAKHWPEVPKHDDVRTAIEWWGAVPRPRVDVICGGFPCQDISIAGKKAGIIEGERSSLWTYLANSVRVLRPRFVVVENVAAILGRGLDVVAADLAEIGYDLRWDCVPAAAVGAHHRRDRWFGLAYPQRQQLREQSVPERWRSGQALARRDGTARELADAAGIGRGQGRPGGPDREGADGPAIGAGALADTDSTGLEGRRVQGTAAERDPRGGTAVAYADREPMVWPAVARGERDPWATEPDVGRVADGVPARVDRLRALGNAVVPQVAEHIGRVVMAHALAVAA